MVLDIIALVSLAAPLITAMVAVIGVLAQHFTTIASIKERLACLETKIEPFWKLVETQLPSMLKHPTCPRRDELLDKMSTGSLTYDEAVELESNLQHDLKLNSIPDLKIAYVLVIGRLAQIIHEMRWQLDRG